MPRTAILWAAWSTMMENWLCQSLDGTISTCTPSSTAMEGSILMWMAKRWPWLKPRERIGTLPYTLPVFSTWKQMTSSPFKRLLSASFIWLPFTPTLARIWFKNLMSGYCTITLTIKGINFFSVKSAKFPSIRKTFCSNTFLNNGL